MNVTKDKKRKVAFRTFSLQTLFAFNMKMTKVFEQSVIFDENNIIFWFFSHCPLNFSFCIKILFFL